jgi:hypothetical protein
MLPRVSVHQPERFVWSSVDHLLKNQICTIGVARKITFLQETFQRCPEQGPFYLRVSSGVAYFPDFPLRRPALRELFPVPAKLFLFAQV